MLITRCSWVKLNNPLYVEYHDTEWGVPTHDDQRLFEFILLESAQAGLSWEIILKKREGYKNAYANFNPEIVARFQEKDVKKLFENSDIVRNKLKIKASIQNAQIFLKIQDEFGSFSNYMWNWVNNVPIQSQHKLDESLPTHTKKAIDVSSDLKKRGFTFFGPTVCYAYMQATGMVNDHATVCFCHKKLLHF